MLVHQRVVHNPNGPNVFHCSVCHRKINNKYRKDIHENRHRQSNANNNNTSSGTNTTTSSSNKPAEAKWAHG